MNDERQEGLGSPFALTQESESALNSNTKKHKLIVVDLPERKHHKSIPQNNYIMTRATQKTKTIEYPKQDKNLIGRLSKIEGGQSVNLLKLSKSIETKSERITQLNNRIMTLKTQRANQEFENFKLDDEYIKLKEQLAILNDQIEELKHHERESLKSLQDKYKITTKKLKLSNDEKLHRLKEDVSKQIETLIDENLFKHESEKKKLSNQCDEISKQIRSQEQDLNRRLIKLKEDHNKKLIQLNSSMEKTIEALKSDIQNLDDDKVSKTKEIEALEKDLALNLNEVNKRLNSKLNDIRSKFQDKELEIATLQNKIHAVKSSINLLKDSFHDKSQEIEDLNNQTDALHSRLAHQENERRSLHNKLQDLKGNIRVFCRIRPDNNEKQASIEIPDDEFNEDANQELVLSRDSNENSSSYSFKNNNSYKFQFDKIFSTNSTNEDIFEELSQLIQSSLDGYNVCVFAYGQTGSGKTYTMSHPENGMIPLSIKKIFEDIEDLKLKDWSYTVEGQFLEIYNESIIDLLTPNSSSSKHEIKHDDINCKTSITNITSVRITSKDQAKSVLEKATKNRSTASTKANERSSRSHSIFILKLYGKNSKTQQLSEGILNLIDLAGSERLSNSQAKGDRLKETQAINKSLSCLGDVIYSLGQQQSQQQSHQHVPYRNSKLTYLLKHSLGASSKTLMFVNISPSLKDFGETVNSLRFATKVNSTKLDRKPGSR